MTLVSPDVSRSIAVPAAARLAAASDDVPIDVKAGSPAPFDVLYGRGLQRLRGEVRRVDK